MKPFSEACERNQEPIFEYLQDLLAPSKHVLEIGSGTGQHAVYFAQRLPHLLWQTSDVEANLSGINLWLEEANLNNTPKALTLDLDHSENIQPEYDAIFSANTLHIVSQEQVIKFFTLVGRLLNQQGKLIVYGPFNYNGEFTSESNARFDVWLKQRDPKSGIRDFETVCELANQHNFELQNDYTMPANNRLLVWQK